MSIIENVIEKDRFGKTANMLQETLQFSFVSDILNIRAIFYQGGNKMQIKEIVEMINGKDEKGKAKSAITLTSTMIHIDKTMRDTGTISCHHPIVTLKRRGKYVEIDLTFLSSLDNDLKMLWGMLESHGKKVELISSESVEIPVISLTVVPIEAECQYYAVASNPIFWTIQPEQPGYEAKVLRLVFENVNVQFYKTKGLDMEMIDDEVEREVEG